MNFGELLFGGHLNYPPKRSASFEKALSIPIDGDRCCCFCCPEYRLTRLNFFELALYPPLGYVLRSSISEGAPFTHYDSLWRDVEFTQVYPISATFRYSFYFPSVVSGLTLNYRYFILEERRRKTSAPFSHSLDFIFKNMSLYDEHPPLISQTLPKTASIEADIAFLDRFVTSFGFTMSYKKFMDYLTAKFPSINQT